MFDYFYVHAHALGKLFHLIKSSFSQASNHTLVLTIRLKLAKNQWILLMKDNEFFFKCTVMFQYSICDLHFGIEKLNGFLSKFFKKNTNRMFLFNLAECQVKSTYSAIKKDSNRIAHNWKQFQRKHKAVPLKFSFIYAPRHFLASDVRHLHHVINYFHAFKNYAILILHWVVRSFWQQTPKSQGTEL